MDNFGTFSFLGILSFIIGVTKEILIIILIFKLIKMSNIFIKKNNTDKQENVNEGLEKDNK
ncbi:MAG TPA: hypothetical protein VK071_09780 [Tissierellales bacterium]|nr:hypothetical protein [Tissierellales bacterium]